MILINDKWEQIHDLQDISKIIRENYNMDLADKLDKLIPEHTDAEYGVLEDILDERETKISILEGKIESLESENEQLQIKIDDL